MITPNYDGELFKIEITVFENCQTMNVIPAKGKSDPSYQAIIGALDIMKTTTIFSQSGINAEKYHEWRKKQRKKQAIEGKQDKKLSGKCWTCSKPIEPDTEGFCDDCWEKGKQEGGGHENP